MKIRNTTVVTLALGTVFLLIVLLAPPARAAIEVERFDGGIETPEGVTVTEAGGHPNFVTEFRIAESRNAAGSRIPTQSLRDLDVDLPPGLVGNPSVAQTCSDADLAGPNATGVVAECPTGAQVGLAEVDAGALGTLSAGIYRMQPHTGIPASFAFNAGSSLVYIDTKLVIDDEGAYALRASSLDTSQALPLVGAKLTFWGVPNDPGNDFQRIVMEEAGGILLPTFDNRAPGPPVPFMSLPTRCSGTSPVVSMRSRSWQQPTEWTTGSFPFHDGSTPPNPVVLDGCEAVPFEPSVTADPTSTEADSTTGLNVRVTLPQRENPAGPSTSAMKRISLALPEGMAVNTSSVGGLGTCSSAQIGMGTEVPVTCPASSKIGTLSINTPLLEKPIDGSVYLASQGDNPFHTLLSLYLVAESKERGVLIKLAGKVEPNPDTGRLVATFDDNPQLPFDTLEVKLKSGPRAPLVNPPSCGTYTTTSELSPWSAGDPDNPTPAEIVTSRSSFEITAGPGGSPCPNGSFDPRLSAGTADPLAGSFSTFQLAVGRADGTRLLSSVTASLPEGLLGKLANIPYCPDSVLSSVPTAEGSGAGQMANSNCPAGSQIGTVTVTAGAGSNPFEVKTGKAYLAGPYRGAPLSVAFLTPAVAGPFDLGNVVDRAALKVDPETAAITAVSDPLPTILHGIPLDLRNVKVAIDRPEFILNPTSCDPMSIDSTIIGAGGASASPNSRFQAASCASLAFAPKLAMSVKGKTRRAAYPAFKAVLTPPPGQANIGRAAVSLPPTEYLENAHIRTVCTRVQYAAGPGGGAQCPAGSIYGFAKAWTPLLDRPLEGPVFLRSSDHKLPDLVASLGGQIHIDLDGRIDSPHKRIRTTFEMVPDAPVSRFVLEMQGGKKGLLVNNTELCKARPKGTAVFTGQNGKQVTLHPMMKAECGGKKPKKK